MEKTIEYVLHAVVKKASSVDRDMFAAGTAATTGTVFTSYV